MHDRSTGRIGGCCSSHLWKTQCHKGRGQSVIQIRDGGGLTMDVCTEEKGVAFEGYRAECVGAVALYGLALSKVP